MNNLADMLGIEKDAVVNAINLIRQKRLLADSQDNSITLLTDRINIVYNERKEGNIGYYSPEYKEEICKRIIDGREKVTHVCAEQNLLENTVRCWLRTYKEREDKPFVGSGNVKPEEFELKRLQREKRELREDNEILKKCRNRLRLRDYIRPKCQTEDTYWFIKAESSNY